MKLRVSFLKSYTSFDCYFSNSSRNMVISNFFFHYSDDSAPGAIRLPEVKNGIPNTLLSLEENQALMKRYLQCPGMCRIEVLKKFVRNKYNVDTNLFYVSS